MNPRDNLVYHFNDILALSQEEKENSVIYLVTVGTFRFYLHNLSELTDEKRVEIMDLSSTFREPAFLYLIPKDRKKIEQELVRLSSLLPRLEDIFDQAYDAAPKQTLKAYNRMIIKRMGKFPRGQYIPHMIEERGGTVYGVCRASDGEFCLVTTYVVMNNVECEEDDRLLLCDFPLSSPPSP